MTRTLPPRPALHKNSVRRLGRGFERTEPHKKHALSSKPRPSLDVSWRKPPRPQARAGFTLIELIVVLVMLSVLMLVSAATLWGAIQVERADSAVFHRMTVQSQLADRFREDVAGAFAAPEKLGQFDTGPTCLILKLADDHHLVYRWADDRLKRAELVGDQSSDSLLPVGGDHVSAAFARSGRGGEVITLRLIESRGAGRSRRDYPVDISAALGGDLR